jgi:putative hemolysin
MNTKLNLSSLVLALSALLITGCGLAAPQPTEEAPVGLANPASVFCEERGYTLEMRLSEDGGVYGVCLFPDGSECEEWAYFRGECSPGAEEAADETTDVVEDQPADQVAPVTEDETAPAACDLPPRLQVGSWGTVTPGEPNAVRSAPGKGDDSVVIGSLPGGTMFTVREGPVCADGYNWWRVEAEDITGWTAEGEAGTYWLEQFNVEPAMEPFEGWVGTIVNLPPGQQLDDYFERDDGERYGISGADDIVQQQIEDYRWTGAQVQVSGQLLSAVPDMENRQVLVERIEAISGTAYEMRNLSPFATTSASSALPSDRWGTYESFSAIDGLLSTPWSEGADGPGVGEWIMLTFPGTIEVNAIGLDVGYDRDENDSLRSPEVFEANNRLKSATIVFSNGEQVQLDFADERGVQLVPLARAPGPPIETTFVQVVIEDVYPGTTYDDTCLAEVEVWGQAR